MMNGVAALPKSKMMKSKGDKHGSKFHPDRPGGAVNYRGPLDGPMLLGYDVRLGRVRHAGAGLDQNGYGGVFRRIRVHPLYSKGR